MQPFCAASLLLAAVMLARPSVAATELEDRAAVRESVQQGFLRQDFSQLEERSRSYRTSKTRTPSGLWKLTFFHIGILDGIESIVETKEQEAAFLDLEGRVKKWIQQYPDSPSAHITQSLVHIAHAWAYRGGGYASEVKPESWAPFRKYISLARKHLEAHKSVAATDPRWYGTMFIVARAQSWERDDFDALLDEALDREPGYYQNYFTALEYLLPKWHGGLAEIEQFAQDAARRTSKQEGHSMYARIYWSASQMEFQNNLFTESAAGWSRMKEGFEDIVARYPDDWNLNNYAKFACLARDKQKYEELMQRIQSAIVLEAWDPPALRQWCADVISRAQ